MAACVVCGRELKGKQQHFCCPSHQAAHTDLRRKRDAFASARRELLAAMRRGKPAPNLFDAYTSAVASLRLACERE